MEELTLEIVTKQINQAGESIKKSAKDAEALAQKALDDFNAFKEKSANKEEIAEMQKHLDALESKMKGVIPVAGQENKMKSWDVQFAEIYKEKAEEIKQVTSGKQKAPLMFEIKDATTVGMFNTIEAEGSVSHYTLTQNTGIISTIRKRLETYLNRVSVGALSMDKPYGMWIEELDEQGNPIFIGEGDDKTEISVRYEEREKKAKKIAVFSKVTTEMLKYLPQLVSFLQNNMMKRVNLATEQQLINGDDTGDNLAGVLGYATDFTGGDMAGTLDADTVNNWDVLLGLISQASKAHGEVNGIFIKGGLLDGLLAVKGTDGHYILPDGVTRDAQGNISAWGVPLIRTEATLTYDGDTYDFFGGDLSVINVGFTGSMTVQIGLDGNDFTKNKKTILVEQELVQFVSANDTQVIIKGDFESAKVLLSST
jgi:hypothetical protein